MIRTTNRLVKTFIEIVDKSLLLASSKQKRIRSSILCIPKIYFSREKKSGKEKEAIVGKGGERDGFPRGNGDAWVDG